MASTATSTQTRAGNARARGGRRGRGGRGGGGQKNHANGAGSRDGQNNQYSKSNEPLNVSPEKQDSELSAEVKQDADADNEAAADEGTVCWICAEPVKYWSVSECNHRTCHVCALRLRALYKKMECTFCKEPQPSVIFTTSPDEPWSSYTPDKIPYKDAKLSIMFETQEMMEETLILLRFNCPDPQCDFIGNGWSDLKLHTRATHGKLMCDLCIRFKKVFAHEHALYEPSQLPIHLPSMARGHRHGNPKQNQQIEGGIHPLCEFCRECFFGDDELYAHMREKHEECFICKRNEVKDQYFRNYEALEEHFMHAHFPCRRGECLARKFVVFGSALDLKAHMVEEHGAEMSARDRRDARRVPAEFEFEEVGAGSGARRGRRDRGDRERDREPPPHLAPQPPGAGARPQAAGARRREAFGGNLTTEGAQAQTQAGGTSQQGSRRQSPSPDLGDEPRLSALVARLHGLAPNPTTAVPAVKAAVRSYKASESSARDLISTVWNILDRNLDGTASIVNSLVDLVDDDEKKQNLLAAWNGFKVEQRNQFPELVPTAIGSEWSGVTSGRVLNAKNSTAARSSAQSSRQLLDRVARAAASTSTSQASTSLVPGRAPAANSFPPLQASAAAGPSTATAFRQPQRVTPWASAGAPAVPAAAPVVRAPTSVPGPGARAKPGPAVFSKSAFPELPSTSAPRVPKAAVSGNQSLKKILGESIPAQPAWKSGRSAGVANGSGESGTSTPGEPSAQGEGETEGGQAQGTVGKKKGKGKQKQTLFTLGSFPT
ncbi:hypothetical protein PYCCODRAFT_1379916 [Trametes coccinea BRFM310]|uniref:RING-type E3 ubiquitin transferase n=1 Tax=Trametes coccinea (strain BRFM310) TaxID=1353009 RepID=A0A1Y2J827_TRAC3|nr:hypothetical protein PYCCODRAFT_1379916 [Trametes coccinea BRFM310]